MDSKPAPRRHSDTTDPDTQTEDTARRCLSKEERARLVMDAWEPSLLRNLLSASDRLKRRRER